MISFIDVARTERNEEEEEKKRGRERKKSHRNESYSLITGVARKRKRGEKRIKVALVLRVSLKTNQRPRSCVIRLNLLPKLEKPTPRYAGSKAYFGKAFVSRG